MSCIGWRNIDSILIIGIFSIVKVVAITVVVFLFICFWVISCFIIYFLEIIAGKWFIRIFTIKIQIRITSWLKLRFIINLFNFNLPQSQWLSFTFFIIIITTTWWTTSFTTFCSWLQLSLLPSTSKVLSNGLLGSSSPSCT